MKLSKHAMIRCQQRGIKLKDIEYIISIGTEKNGYNGAKEYTITYKDAKLLLQRIDKLIGKKIIIGNNGIIITGYNI